MTVPPEIDTTRDGVRVRNIETALRRAEEYEARGMPTHAAGMFGWAMDRYETLPPFLQKRVQW